MRDSHTVLLEKYVSCTMRNVEFMNLSVMLWTGVNCLLEVKQGIVIQVLKYTLPMFCCIASHCSLFLCPIYAVGTFENELYLCIS